MSLHISWSVTTRWFVLVGASLGSTGHSFVQLKLSLASSRAPLRLAAPRPRPPSTLSPLHGQNEASLWRKHLLVLLLPHPPTAGVHHGLIPDTACISLRYLLYLTQIDVQYLTWAVSGLTVSSPPSPTARTASDSRSIVRAMSARVAESTCSVLRPSLLAAAHARVISDPRRRGVGRLTQGVGCADLAVSFTILPSVPLRQHGHSSRPCRHSTTPYLPQ